MTFIGRITRLVVLGLFVAGTIVAAVRFGVGMALSAMGGTLLYAVSQAEQIWPPKTAPVVQKSAADTARVTEGVVIPISIMSENVLRSIAPGVGSSSATLSGGGLSAHGHGQGSMSATLSFRSDVMDRLARGDHPTVRRLG